MRRYVLTALAAGALVAAAPAAGDGGPPQNAIQGWNGAARGAFRYVAVPAGPGWTSLQAIKRDGGRVDRWLTVRGRWGIPSVTPDASGEALLQDDRTIVLGDIGYGIALRKHSAFLLADTKYMRVLHEIHLRGHFVFDAVSPDARYLYLTEFVSPKDFTAYRVRAYDLGTGRLLPKIVSDRSSWETTMQGWPISRVERAGWAFTLYGTGGRPFIHALDTRHVSAVCIDLPWANEPSNLWSYRLGFDRDGHLVVRGPKGHTRFTLTRNLST